MFPSPDLSHATEKDYCEVYEPAEDTFLLMDALEKDHKFIISLQPLVCVEVGCGCGAVSAFLAGLLGARSVYFCTDVNAAAADLTLRTGRRNDVSLNPVVCDLVAPLKCRLQRSVDVLIFNPPYVVTSSQEVGGCQLAASWAGGVKGRQVMDRLFVQVAGLLSDRGLFYVLVIKDNDPDDVRQLCVNVGLDVTSVIDRRAGAERLTVLRCRRQSVYSHSDSDSDRADSS